MECLLLRSLYAYIIGITVECILCTDICGKYCVDWQDNVLAWQSPGIGRAVVFMAIQGVVFLAILFIIESGRARAIWQNIVTGTNVPITDDVTDMDPNMDSDVKQESQRIAQTVLSDLVLTDSLIIKDIKKYYGLFPAVDEISIGIPQGECFGLLGVNGAGKTTTFKMLTGDETVSSGNAYLRGFSVIDDIKKVLFLRIVSLLDISHHFILLSTRVAVLKQLAVYRTIAS